MGKRGKTQKNGEEREKKVRGKRKGRFKWVGVENAKDKGLFGTCFRFLFWFHDFFQYSSWNFNLDLNLIL